ncbi:glycolate oxidase subunit GlcE [Alcanivorax marinus]|uniref:Glycolate oxidase subunit GlcE n=1 Tax=Alloalcanivorax marinus TaxID=1177169 RepID=A0A9Q3UNN5_9GAMM|nr:glycolate oxidase subunit GlcE [Alloalcanivorax marinus]MCC4309745.1 glycolate oxidase subunit GlcE [Alloalcanivorax marinus]
MGDQAEALLERVRAARAHRRPLCPRGTGGKSHLGRPVDGEVLDTLGHSGVVHYDPSELVVTARAGTRVSELIATLAEQGQMLPFEPPLFGGDASVGGMVASGLAGPRRPWAGSVRDFVLGTRVITGEGQHLRFGGEVMKNVAGYDLSRLMAGSFGCLGLITEVSFKVLPRPRASRSLQLRLTGEQARDNILGWRRRGLPLSAACHGGGLLRIRLEGNQGSVDAAVAEIGGEPLEDAHYWEKLRDQRLPFFDGAKPLWRLSLPPATPVLDLPGALLSDWGGAQRWLKSDADTDTLRQLAASAGGSATRFSGEEPEDAPFQPLPAPLLRYHQTLKARLDPDRIFNPGRLYADL